MKIIEQDQNLIFIEKEVGEDSEHDLPMKIREVTNTEVFTLHRLDKNVGGVMVYALNKKYAAIMSKLIEQGQMVKEYIALVHGQPEKEGILEDLLFKDSSKNKVFVVKRERRGVKKAKLQYDVFKTNDEYSLVHIRLFTGRSHQIRVQFSSRGYPLVGDHKYGSKAKEIEPYLYSCRISFPYNGQTKIVESEPEWMNII